MCSVLGTVKSNIQNNGGTLLSFSRPYGRRTRRSVIKSHIYQYNPNKDVARPKDNKKTNTLHQPTSKKQWYMLILKGVGIKSQNQKPCTPPLPKQNIQQKHIIQLQHPINKEKYPAPAFSWGSPYVIWLAVLLGFCFLCLCTLLYWSAACCCCFVPVVAMG